MSSSNSRPTRSRARAAKQVRADAPRSEQEPPEPLVDPELDVEDLVDLQPEEVPDDARAWASLSALDQEQRRAELQSRLGAYLRSGRARVVLTDNVYSMVTIKRGDGVSTFRVHHMFADAPARVIRALAQYADQQSRDAATLLRDFIDANDDQVRQRDSPRPVTVDVEGRHHNLQEIFDRLNATYFDGAIRARITWGSRSKRKRSRDSIKLGSYTLEDELIRIHPVLDAADVPAFFVEWVVYHEMLHEVHDMPIVDGRRVYHTAEFRRAEAQFERYAEAVMWERTHLVKLLER
ncbi:MAG: hypothetical protein ACE37F_10735 [Nannocystaceae bacterium]|nr:hypothetical protein [bacterium]